MNAELFDHLTRFIGRDPGTVKSILFVCTGNTCRSPMAEGYLKKRLLAVGISGIQVSSGGTLGLIDSPASKNARRASSPHGIDLLGHLSSKLTDERLAATDLILAMDQGHVDEISKQFPEAASRIQLLGLFSPIRPNEIIHDPVNLDLKVFGFTLSQMAACIDRLIQWLTFETETR
jgi:protein-tyrosine-phosphatase